MILSFDIGGTKIASGIVSGDFKVSEFKKINTPSNKEDFFEVINKQIKECSQKYKLDKIGIGCAGLVEKSGKIINSPNLPFLNGLDLNQYLNIKPVPLAPKGKWHLFDFSNDVQCFTLAEAICGAGKKYNSIIGLTIGTGIGGGIVLNKQIFKGSQNFAGEFGHITIDLNYPEQCKCGNYGCLEQFVSGKAIERYYEEFSGEKKSAKEIEDLSYEGNKNALQAIEKMANYLSIGLANIVHSINPDAIIIGGSVGKTKTLFEPAIKSMRSRLLSPEIKVEILPSELGDNAILIGAAML